MLDLCPPSSASSAEFCVQDDMKNSFAAFSTDLITKHPKVNDSHTPPNTEPESLPPAPGLLMAAEAPMVDHAQLPGGVDLPARSGPEMISNEVIDAAFENFLAQFDESQAEATPVYSPPSIPTTSMTQYTVDDGLVSFLPPSVDVAPVSTLAQYDEGYNYTVNNAFYAPYGYPTEAMSFDGQFSQLYSFAAPDMGVYPQVVDQTYMYTSPVGASSFPMQGLYVY